MAARVRFALVFLALGLFFAPACGEEPAPAAPSFAEGGVPGGGGVTRPSDAGDPAAVDGGDASDAGLGRCTPADGSNALSLEQGGVPVSFPIDGAFFEWGAGLDCAPARLFVGLAAGGCDSTQVLRLEIRRDSIGTEVVVGSNLVRPFPLDELLRVRLQVGGRIYGTCEGTSGELELTDIGERPGDAIEGTFDLTLTACDDATAPPIRAVGGFEGVLLQSYDEVCGGS